MCPIFDIQKHLKCIKFEICPGPIGGQIDILKKYFLTHCSQYCTGFIEFILFYLVCCSNNSGDKSKQFHSIEHSIALCAGLMVSWDVEICVSFQCAKIQLMVGSKLYQRNEGESKRKQLLDQVNKNYLLHYLCDGFVYLPFFRIISTFTQIVYLRILR